MHIGRLDCLFAVENIEIISRLLQSRKLKLICFFDVHTYLHLPDNRRVICAPKLDPSCLFAPSRLLVA